MANHGTATILAQAVLYSLNAAHDEMIDSPASTEYVNGFHEAVKAVLDVIEPVILQAAAQN